MTRSEEGTLNLASEDFRRLGHRAVDFVADYLAALPDRPCRTPVPADRQHALMHEPVPEHGTRLDQLLDDVESLFQYPMGNGSPRFFGWVNSPPAPIGIIAELLAAGLNPSVAGGDHAATYIEHAALGWMRAIVGYPTDSGGLLTSGGSVANLIGLAVMRHVKSGRTVRVRGLRNVGSTLVVYASTEGHSCIQKAIELLGIGSAQLRRVPVTSEWQMDIGALRDMIARDRAVGLTPACVVATAGTVNTGTIDPLDVIADLCASEDIWLHVDAAYGGPGAMLSALAPLYRGLDRADSLAIDPHKWMYVPVECGCALVRDRAAMRDAFSLVPAYLRDDAALPWFSEFGIQQSRGFRALKLWMCLKYAGLDGYRNSIARDLALTRTLRQRLHESPDFQIVSAGPLSITCFRYVPGDGRDEAAVDRMNRMLLDAVQHEGEVFLTGTDLAGRFVLRSCIVNFRTTEEDVARLVNVVREVGQRVAEQSSQAS
jgi:glutamate/tyrosine decarboxylase-like PLP-dependent enzyme